jgi:hypothetical protein
MWFGLCSTRCQGPVTNIITDSEMNAVWLHRDFVGGNKMPSYIFGS